MKWSDIVVCIDNADSSFLADYDNKYDDNVLSYACVICNQNKTPQSLALVDAILKQKIGEISGVGKVFVHSLSDYLDLAKLLLKYNFKPSKYSLIDCCCNENVNGVRILIPFFEKEELEKIIVHTKSPTIMDEFVKNGVNPRDKMVMNSAIKVGNIELAEFLLQRGSDLHDDNDFVFRTALPTSIDMCKWCINQGCSWKHLNKYQDIKMTLLSMTDKRRPNLFD
jgi:hypothetical protein